jgi:hypothetical protein
MDSVFFTAFLDELEKIAERRFYVGSKGPSETYVTNVQKRSPSLAKPAAPKPTFKPSRNWQDVPHGAVLPPGLEINMNMSTGRQQARMSA